MLKIKISVLFCSILYLTTSAFAGELSNECESAVDAADRLGSDISKDCDYSNTGINGVLHRALSEKESVPAEEKSPKEKRKIIPNVEALPIVVSAEFGAAQELADIRYRLIIKAAKECTNGFVVNSEQYLPTQTALLKLELNYKCL